MIKICNITIPRFLIALGLLTLSFIYLFVKLAIWQLDRLEEKKLILQKINENKHVAEILSTQQLDRLPEYSRVLINGYFDYKHPIFLSSQFYNHRPGYHVVLPFILAHNTTQQNSEYAISKQIILVNCGWLENPNSYKSALDSKNKKVIKVIGIVKKSNTDQYIMGNNLSIVDHNVHIQKINTSEPELITLYTNNYNIASNYLRLISPNQGYITNWTWTNISPQKHFAYAIQWLLLAFTTVLLYSCLCYKTIRP